MKNSSAIALNNYIQKYLNEHRMQEIQGAELSPILQKAGLTNTYRPVLGNRDATGLRVQIYQDHVLGAYQKPNGRWYIKKVENYVPLISIHEAAERLGISKQAMYKRIAIGKYEIVKLGMIQAIREDFQETEDSKILSEDHKVRDFYEPSISGLDKELLLRELKMLRLDVQQLSTKMEQIQIRAGLIEQMLTKE
jgi:hypothetical protein